MGASWPPNEELIVTPGRPAMVATSLSLAAVTSAEKLAGCEVEGGMLDEMPAACNPCRTEVVIVVTKDGISKEPLWACVVPAEGEFRREGRTIPRSIPAEAGTSIAWDST